MFKLKGIMTANLMVLGCILLIGIAVSVKDEMILIIKRTH